MTENIKKPESILTEVKILLKSAVKDRHHPYHTPVFSNISNDNKSNSRVIVLRNFDEKEFIMNFHSDFRSPKIKDLQKNKQSSFLFYDAKKKIQLRIRTNSKINHENNITKNAWEKTSLSSRKCYLAMYAPSSITSKLDDGIPSHLKGIDPGIEESEYGYQNFVVIQNKILDIDWLHLSSSGHKRLLIKIKKEMSANRWVNKLHYNWIIP